MTTGDLLVARVAMKPLATLNRPVLKTVDIETKEESVSFKERTDVTAVPAAGVVAETMVALVLASEALRKFGGDSLAEFVRNHDAYRASLAMTRATASRAGRSDGRGQDDGRAPVRERLGRAVRRHRRPDRDARARCRSTRSSRAAARRASASWSARSSPTCARRRSRS